MERLNYSLQTYSLPVYAYKFEGNCYDVGTFDSLNLVREKYNKK